MFDALIIKTAGLDKENRKLFAETAEIFERFCDTRVSRYPDFIVIESIRFSPLDMLKAFEKHNVPFWHKCKYAIIPSRNIWEMFCEIEGKFMCVVDQTVTDRYDKELEDETLWYPECKNSQDLTDSPLW